MIKSNHKRCGLIRFLAAYGVIAGGVAVAAEPLDNTWQTLQYASEFQIHSISVRGTKRIVKQPEHISTDQEIEKHVTDFKADMRDKAEKGLLDPGPYRETMEKQFGVSDYRLILNNPRVREGLENYLSERSDQYRRRLLLNNSPQEITEKYEASFDPKLGLRIETTVLGEKVGDIPNSTAAGINTITTVDSASIKEFRVQTKGAVISPGEGQNRGTMASLAGNPSLLRGGQPRMIFWSQPDLKSTQTVKTPEGSAIQIVLDNGKSSATLWVLPDKGYHLYREEMRIAGRLRSACEYGKYKEVATGWYPMQQRQQQYLRDTVVETDELQLDDVTVNAPLEAKLFDQELPVGTAVTDLRHGIEKPINFTVGGMTDDEAARAISQISAGAPALASIAEPTPHKRAPVVAQDSAAPRAAGDAPVSAPIAAMGDVSTPVAVAASSSSAVLRWLGIVGVLMLTVAGATTWFAIHRRKTK